MRENYRKFCEAVGVDMEQLVVGMQVHGDEILSLRMSNDLSKSGWNKPINSTDGFMTNIPGVPLMVKMADCQAVLFFDPVRRVIAAVHSGWRGNVQNIIGKAAQKMIAEFGCKAENILVGISQSLGPCCAEFSEPEKELPEWMQKYVGKNAGVKKRHADLWKCSFDQLTEKGVLPKNIEIMRRCTCCESDVFFSYRSEGEKAGRMGAIIELKPLDQIEETEKDWKKNGGLTLKEIKKKYNL